MPSPRTPETPMFLPCPITVKSTPRWSNTLALGASPWDDEDEREFASDSEKLAGLTDAALNLAAVYFPLLSESVWDALIDAQLFVTGSFCEYIQLATQDKRYLDYLTGTTSLTQDVSQAEYDGLASLERGAWLSIVLAGNLYWSTQNADVRRLLSHISGRPYECVFVTDPAPEDLWRVIRVDHIDDLTRRVVLAFGDDAESCSVDLKRHTSGIVHIDGITYDFDQRFPRYCSIPGTNTLFSVAMPLAHAAGLPTYEHLGPKDIAASKVASLLPAKLYWSPHFPE